jgi:hypothetical protein
MGVWVRVSLGQKTRPTKSTAAATTPFKVERAHVLLAQAIEDIVKD